MKQNGNEVLLKLQQGELDAVLVYRKLAELASSEEEKNVLLSSLAIVEDENSFEFFIIFKIAFNIISPLYISKKQMIINLNCYYKEFDNYFQLSFAIEYFY